MKKLTIEQARKQGLIVDTCTYPFYAYTEGRRFDSNAPCAECYTELEASLLDAIEKLIKAKGRHHTEQNYAALVAAYHAAKGQP